MPSFHDLEKIAGFGFLQREQQILIKDQQLDLFVFFHHLPVCSVSTGDRQLSEEVWKTDILDRVEASVGRHPKRRSEICFSHTGGAENDHVVGFKNVGAG